MKFFAAEIDGVTLVEPDVHGDARGFLFESYHFEKYAAAGIADRFVQDDCSRSKRSVLRGLHAQRRNPQARLVRAIEGEIFCVAVDVRRGSPSFSQYVGVHLSASNFRQLYIPAGFSHGFCVVSEVAEVGTKRSSLYDAADQFGIAWNDPDIDVSWPVDSPLLSEKDRSAPRLRDVRNLLPVFAGA